MRKDGIEIQDSNVSLRSYENIDETGNKLLEVVSASNRHLSAVSMCTRGYIDLMRNDMMWKLGEVFCGREEG